MALLQNLGKYENDEKRFVQQEVPAEGPALNVLALDLSRVMSKLHFTIIIINCHLCSG